MTHAVSAPSSTQPHAATTVPVVILGTDALLAAAPATPVQLAHACLRAGFANAIPASWGDELVAAATLHALELHGGGPAVQCSCPIVAHRLLTVGGDLRGALVPLVSPPVAVARYLRALADPTPIRVTYVGRCPGAIDDTIDIRMTPDALLATLAERQIQLQDQPRVFESVLPPDRRRFRSQPGGVPTVDSLWAESGSRALVEIEGPDVVTELAQHLLAGKNVLVDVAPRLGCYCSGAVAGTPTKDARAIVTALEPPRATAPVIDDHPSIDLELPIPAAPRTPVDVVAVSPYPTPSAPLVAPIGGSMAKSHRISPVVGVSGVRETRSARTSNPSTRAIAGIVPTTRDADGKALPRTYVARRRSSPKGLPVIPLPSDEERDHASSPPTESDARRTAPEHVDSPITEPRAALSRSRAAVFTAAATDLASPTSASSNPATSDAPPAHPSAPSTMLPASPSPSAAGHGVPAPQTMFSSRNLLIGAIVLLAGVVVLTLSVSAVVATIVGRSLRAPPTAVSSPPR
jgi:hypothetical protein